MAPTLILGYGIRPNSTNKLIARRGGREAMRWLSDLLYGSVTAEFESRFGLQESVGRLSAATRRFAFPTLKQVAVGRVSRSRVSLYRAIPFFQNSFAPHFFGAFHERGGRTVLSGRFAMSWFAKAFITLWLGFCVVSTGLAVADALASGQHLGLSSFGGVAMFGFGVIFVWFGKWLSRNDIPWLSKVIQEALSASVHRDLAVEAPSHRC